MDTMGHDVGKWAFHLSPNKDCRTEGSNFGEVDGKENPKEPVDVLYY